MDTCKLRELFELAAQKMNCGDFDGALHCCRQMQLLGPHYLVSYLVSGLLIDIGNILGKENLIREGAKLLESDFETIIQHRDYAPRAYYYLANANLALSNLEKMRDPYFACFKKTYLYEAKDYLRKALKYDIDDQMLRAQILVNLGNCFDDLGRVIDALECYDQSLELNKDHGMALGNKGMAFLNYAVLNGEHQGTFVTEAYFLLMRALKLGVPPEATSVFSKYIQLIGKSCTNKQFLKNPPKYPGYRIKARSNFEKFLTKFCLSNKLYLNMCNFCQRCDAAIGDTAVIKTMIVPAKSDTFLILSAYLNQIKQDFVTARFLLILSRYEGLNLSFVDKRVRIVDTLDYNIHNIYIQLIKTSFKTFYDILDKIAFFINDYLKLGIPEMSIDFTKIWYEDKKTTIRSKIMDTKNLSLNALFDIHRDLDYGVNKPLKNIRNALTHRFVNIKAIQEVEGPKNMTEGQLVERTLELARIVRNSIMYLLHFVYVEETKKKAKIEGAILPLFAHELSDWLKATNRRRLTKPRKNKKILKGQVEK